MEIAWAPNISGERLRTKLTNVNDRIETLEHTFIESFATEDTQDTPSLDALAEITETRRKILEDGKASDAKIDEILDLFGETCVNAREKEEEKRRIVAKKLSKMSTKVKDCVEDIQNSLINKLDKKEMELRDLRALLASTQGAEGATKQLVADLMQKLETQGNSTSNEDTAAMQKVYGEAKAQMETSRDELRGELAGIKGKLDEKEKLENEGREKINQLGQERSALQTRFENSESSLAEMKSLYETLTSENEKLATRNEEMAKSLAATNEKLATQTQNSTSKQAQIERLEYAQKEASMQHTKEILRLAEDGLETRDLVNEIQSVKRERGTMRMEVLTLKAEVVEKDKKTKNLETEMVKKENLYRESERSRKLLTRNLFEKSVSLTQKNEDFQKANENVARLEAKNAGFQKKLDENLVQKAFDDSQLDQVQLSLEEAKADLRRCESHRDESYHQREILRDSLNQKVDQAKAAASEVQLSAAVAAQVSETEKKQMEILFNHQLQLEVEKARLAAENEFLSY